MFDPVAQQRLQAMGFTLYAPVRAPAAAHSPAVLATPAASAVDAPVHPFWDSALGRNVRRHAGTADVTAIALPADPVRAKKALWHAIRAQRRPQ